MKKIDIYTDGACSGNPGAGGYACILVYGKKEKEISGGAADTTNNRMELSAVIAGLLVASGIESVLRNEFADYTPGDAFEAAIENTLPDWAAAYVSLYESIDDLADAMTLNLNYNKEIIDYCACHTGYNVLFEMKNGSTYKLKDVCDMMGE